MEGSHRWGRARSWPAPPPRSLAGQSVQRGAGAEGGDGEHVVVGDADGCRFGGGGAGEKFRGGQGVAAGVVADGAEGLVVGEGGGLPADGERDELQRLVVDDIAAGEGGVAGAREVVCSQ